MVKPRRHRPGSILGNTVVVNLGNFDIGAWLKKTTGSSKIGNADFSGVQLRYYPQGVSQGLPPTNAKQFFDAIGQLDSNPLLQEKLLTYFNLTKSSKTSAKNLAWNSIIDAKYNLTDAVNPAVAAANAKVKSLLTFGENLQNALRDQRAAGISSATAGQQANAIDNVRNTIEAWNYTPQQKQFLSEIVGRLVTVNGDHIVNQNALLNIIRGLTPSGLGAGVDAKIKADYNNAFPGLAAYNSQPGAIHMNEQAYNTYTTKIQDSATQYGAPMPTQAQIGKLLNGHVSAAEYSQRVTDIYAQVANADAGTKAFLQREYGVGPGDLMHYFMDPKNALQNMQRQVASAEIQDYAQRVGLKGLDKTGGEQLADMAKLAAASGNNPLGFGIGNIEQSLLAASRDVGLEASQPGAGTPTVDTKTLIGSQLAGFGGTNQQSAQVQVARAEQAKAAPFEKGGGYVETQKGVEGLGSART